MRERTIILGIALICAAAVACGFALAADPPSRGRAQVLALRQACRSPELSQRVDPGLRIEADAVIIDEPALRLQWSIPADGPPPLRNFLVHRSGLQVSAIAACLRGEAAAGRWPDPPYERYTRTAAWSAGDGRAGLQVWYLNDVDDLGTQGLYASPVIWDVPGQRGLTFRDLLSPEGSPHFEAALCSALRRHPHTRARLEAPCPKLDPVKVMFMSDGCVLPPPAGGFKVEAVTAWYRWQDSEFALRLPHSDFQDDLRPEFRSRFGRVAGCPPPI